MTLTVDPGVAFSGSAPVRNGDTLTAVREAYTQAQQRFDPTREAVMIEVLVRVAPKTIDFDSDAPLIGGVCDLSAGCESCQ